MYIAYERATAFFNRVLMNEENADAGCIRKIVDIWVVKLCD